MTKEFFEKKQVQWGEKLEPVFTEEIDIKPWMEPGFPSILFDTYKNLEGLKFETTVRFPIPLLGTIHVRGLLINGESMHEIRQKQAIEMIEKNIKSKDFVFEWPSEKRNPLPYTITLIIYSKQMPGLDGPPYYCVPAICVSIQYNREKYIEMAKYPFNEEEICKEYINHGDLNIRMGKLREEMK